MGDVRKRADFYEQIPSRVMLDVRSKWNNRDNAKGGDEDSVDLHSWLNFG